MPELELTTFTRVLVGKYCLGSISMEPRWSPACDLLTVPWLLWILPVVHVHIFTAIEKGHYLNIIPIVTIFYLFFFNPLNFYHVTCLLVTTSLVIRYCFTLFRNTLSPYWTGWSVRYRKWSPTVNDPPGLKLPDLCVTFVIETNTGKYRPFALLDQVINFR